MDIEVNTLAQIKAETGRDLDNQVDENTLVSGEKSNGTFGVFKLFAAIKNCIDNWITTIAGAKNFTGAVTINSKAVATTEAVNNALTDYKNGIVMTDLDLNNYIVAGRYLSQMNVEYSNCPTQNFSLEVIKLLTTNGYCNQIITNYSSNKIYTRSLYFDGSKKTWTEWEQIATKSDIYNLIYDNTKGANYTDMNFGNGNFKFVAYSNDGGYCTGEFTQIDNIFMGATQSNNGSLSVLGQAKDTIYFSKSLVNLKVWRLS